MMPSSRLDCPLSLKTPNMGNTGSYSWPEVLEPKPSDREPVKPRGWFTYDLSVPAPLLILGRNIVALLVMSAFVFFLVRFSRIRTSF